MPAYLIGRELGYSDNVIRTTRCVARQCAEAGAELGRRVVAAENEQVMEGRHGVLKPALGKALVQAVEQGGLPAQQRAGELFQQTP